MLVILPEFSDGNHFLDNDWYIVKQKITANVRMKLCKSRLDNNGWKLVVTMPLLSQKTCQLVSMLVCIAWFSLVCWPSTNWTVVIVPVEPSHNTLLVECMAAR